MAGSTVIWERDVLRGLCLEVAGVDLTTEFWEVEGARGWEARLLAVVVDVVVTVLAMEAVRFRGFSGTLEVLRLLVVRGAIFYENGVRGGSKRWKGQKAKTR